MNCRKIDDHTNPNIQTRIIGKGMSNYDDKIGEIEVGKRVKQSDGTWSLTNKGEGFREVITYAHFELPKQ